MPYSTKDDLRKGDIRLPIRLGDGSSFVEEAADEIDAQLGHIYVTPFAIDETEPRNRPTVLLLKKINNLLASGRLVLDLAASSEDDNLHAYGASMLKEGLALLKMIQDRDILLAGADLLIDDEGEKSPTGPIIYNEDSGSLVQTFYDQPSFAVGAESYPTGPSRPRPYDNQGV